MRLDERKVVARVRRLTLRDLRLWVREGWVRPAESTAGPVFDDIDIARIRLICDLRKDMSLPPDALPVVLALIDNMHAMRRDLRHLRTAVSEEPEDVRRSILERYVAYRQGGDEDLR